MLSKKTLIIISVIILVIIGLALAILLVDDSFFNKSETINFDQDQIIDDIEVVEEIKPEPEVIINLTPTEVTVITVANNFAERFASYSTDSNTTNLEEVKLLSSSWLINKLDDMIDNVGEANEFYGISSKVLKTNIDSLDESNGQASLTITLQRQETMGSETKVIYQDLELTLVKTGNNWLVNDFEWLN